MATQLASNPTTSAIGHSEIQPYFHAFTSNSLAITKNFQDIFDELTHYSTQGDQLAPKWQPIMQNLTNVLAASRNTASDIAAYCTKVTTATLPVSADLTKTIPATLSVEVLTEYIAMTDSLGARAQATSDAFTALSNSVNAFISMFNKEQSRTISVNETYVGSKNNLQAFGAMRALEVKRQANMTACQRALAPVSGVNSNSQSAGFSAIWNAVKSDCTSLSSFLKIANDPVIRKYPQIFWGTLNNVNGSNTAIAEGVKLLHS
ncbi:hypothetical protein B0H17DRAFT_1145793 [Mycena rosella]|uniref:Uncharacterized protein n=1 Tax=Mycena rosella TaxID=1033263 RepID=A0AAD7CQ66_MYCRO|nr:hypothetical protein B0H17DRAFT_1145793 [Mycena rosella]